MRPHGTGPLLASDQELTHRRGKPVDHELEPVPLRAELAALGWSCEQLIARVNQRRAKRESLPLHSKTAYPWMRGERPSAEVARDVLAVLCQHTGRKLTDVDLGWNRSRPRRRPRSLDNPYGATATELLRETQGDTPMQRRSFLQLSGAAATAPVLDLLMGGAPALRAAQDGDRVSAQLTTTIERTVQQARDLDDSEGSASTLLWAGGIWQNLGTLLLESRYRAAEGVRLHTAYIEMSETYGWMLFDAGLHPQAQRVYQTGMRLAREAHDAPGVHRATVNLLASAAYQESWLGQFHEASALLRVAEDRRPKHSPRACAPSWRCAESRWPVRWATLKPSTVPTDRPAPTWPTPATPKNPGGACG